MLTVASLLSESGLELAAGKANSKRAIRWVHISELEDPTPWLSGGELLLTTGIRLTEPAAQRRLVELLDGCGAAGLGFGVGFDHESLPPALVDEARKRKLPVFEVPYEMPFIALTKRASQQLVNEQFGVLERSSEVHERLERLVLEGRGLHEVTGSIAEAVRGSALVLDGAGAEVTRHPSRGGPSTATVKAIGAELAERGESTQATAFALEQPTLSERSFAVAVPGRRGAAPVGWLVVIADGESLGEFERLIARQAAIVIGLELMRERVVRETERRLAGDLLADALSGRLEADEMRGRLRPFGVGAEAAVAVFELDDPSGAEASLEAALAALEAPSLVATTSTGGRPLLCAVLDVDGRDPLALARAGREALLAKRPRVRAAVSRPIAVDALRRGFHEARCALEATSLADGQAPDVASHRDLGAFTLLLALQDDDALRLYSEGLLEPIEHGEGEYGGELLRSLEAFIENNGNWERAARQLFCHRHTLRYRIRKIEELTGRDLGRATDRIELWLALRARELVR